MLSTVTFLTTGFRSAFPIAGGYLLLYAAFTPALPLSRFGRYGDFSYGLYVFAYPIQQTIVHALGPGLPLPVFFTLSFGTTLALACASWHLIEAPALSLKPRVARERSDELLRIGRGAEVSKVVTVSAASQNL